MMDADGGMLFGPASPDEPGSVADDDIMFPVSPDPVRDAPEERRRPVASARRSGCFGVWLLADDSPDRPGIVHGLAKMHWECAKPAPHLAASHAAAPSSVDGGSARDVWGYLQYSVHDAWLLDSAVELPVGFDARAVTAAQQVADLCATTTFQGGHQGGDVFDALAVAVSSVFWLSAAAAQLVRGGVCDVLVRSVSLGKRLKVPSIVRGFPMLLSLRRLRASWRDGRQQGVSFGPETSEAYWKRCNDELLRLPAWADPLTHETPPTRRQFCAGTLQDPVKLLHALDLCQYLRSTRFFTPAMNVAHKFDHGDSAPPRDSRHDKSRTQFDRAQSVLDCVDMLMDRRALRADRIFDRLSSINLCSDSSPVTGEELQGMVADTIYKDRSTRRSILPGCSLAYGQFNAVAKCMALVWSCF